MALADYKKCAVCQGKAIYDGDDALEARSQGEVWLEVICEDCAKLHSVLVVPNGTLAELMYRLRDGGDKDRLVAWGSLWQLLRPAVPPEFDGKPKPLKDMVSLCYFDAEDTPFLYAVHGRFGVDDLKQIEEEVADDWPNELIFDKGFGIYTFSVAYQQAQVGDFGRIEIPAHYELDFEAFEPLPAQREARP